MTYRQAKQLLCVGDTVYTIDNHTRKAHTIEAVLVTCIRVNDGYLYYDEVAQTWWLTPRGVADAIKLDTGSPVLYNGHI